MPGLDSPRCEQLWVSSFWQDFWFAPSSPLWLGGQRALYCALIFANVCLEQRWRFLELPAVFRQPAFPVGWLPLPDARWGRRLEILWKASLLTACLGLATGLSLAVAALLSLYWFSLPNQFGVQHHRNHLTVQALLVLALSRCGDAFSLDQLLSGVSTPGWSGEYTWPARMICLCLTAMFAAAGWTKLRWSGPGWVDSLPLYLVRGLCLPYDARPLSRYNLRLARRKRLCRLGATLVLGLECLAPLGLLALLPGNGLFYLLPLGMLAALGGIRFLLGPAFFNVAAAHIFWLTPAGHRVYGPASFWVLPLIALFLAATAVCWLLQRDFFPFSNYPMYAWRCESSLERLILMGVNPEGQEVELWDRNQCRLRPLDRWTVHLHLQRNQVLEECLQLARGNGLALSGIRLYQARWRFSADQSAPPLPELQLVQELHAKP